MQKFNAASNNQENIIIIKYKCPCPGNKNPTLSRRADRPPLAGIQGSNNAINNNAKSKSTSSSTKIPSPIKFLGNVRPREQPKRAEPPPVIKLPPRIKVHSAKSLNSKASVPRKVSPCRCLFKLEPKTENAIDDVFLPKTPSTPIDKLLKPKQQPSGTAISTKSDLPSKYYEASTLEIQPNSTKPIQKSTLDSYTSTVTMPPTPHEPSLLKISSISGFLEEVAKIALDTRPLDSARFSKTPEFDSTILGKLTVKRDTSMVVDKDKTLIDAENFFQDLDRGKVVEVKTQSVFSPVKSSMPLRRSISDASIQKELFRKPAVKTSLLRRRSSSIRREIYFPLLYSPEYIEAIINYLYINKNNNLLLNKWVIMYIAKSHRTDILNWLLEISDHYFSQFEAPYYMAVRLMDYAIAKLTLASSQYQLAAIASLWIAGKFLEGSPRLNKASKLFALCSGKYSTVQILAMERNILKSVDYCLNLPDPMDFLFNYLKLSNMENDEKLILTSKFIMECASLFESYCLVTPSFMAASVLYMALQVVRKGTEVYVYFLWYDWERIKNFIERVLRVNVKCSLMAQYAPVLRYSEVAHLFADI